MGGNRGQWVRESDGALMTGATTRTDPHNALSVSEVHHALIDSEGLCVWGETGNDRARCYLLPDQGGRRNATYGV